MHSLKRTIFITTISIIYFGLALLTSATAQTYQWAKRMGNTGIDGGINIALDANGNSYITGSFQGTVDFDPGAATAYLTAIGGDDIFFAKYDSNGNYIYAKSIGSNSDDMGNSIVVDQSGNCYITGYYWGSADFDPSAGTANLTPVGVNDIFFAKYDPSGNYIFAKTIGSTGNDIGYGIVADISGNCYITGFFQGIADFNPGAGTANLTPINGNAGIYFAKYDLNGNYIYAHTIETSIAGLGHSIGVDALGNCYITGTFWGTADFDPDALGTANLYASTGWNVYLACYDPSGAYVFANSICSASGNNNYGMATDALGNCYLTGSFNGISDFDPGIGITNLTPVGNDDIYFAKYDPNGNYLFAKSIGSPNYDGGNNIVADSSGNCYLTGWFQETADFNPDTITSDSLTAIGTNDIFFAKYDPNGNYIYAKSIGSSGYDSGNGIAVDNNGICFITGSFSSTADFDPDAGIANLISTGSSDIFIAKYNSCSTDIPVITPFSTTTFCQGDSVQLLSTNASSYLWSNGDTTQSIIVSTSGNFSVLVTDANGCVASSLATTITVNPLPAIPIISVSGDTLSSSASSGNQWYFNGSILNGATSPEYIVLQDGVYTVVTTNSNGCLSTSAPYNFISVGLSILKPEARISISPNPGNGKFYIQFENLHPAKIIIYNLTGEIAYESEVRFSEFDLTGQPRGTYLIKLVFSEQIIYRKIILE